MKVFTIQSGRVERGAEVKPFTFANGSITIPAVQVGERGRGRELGVLPVEHAPTEPCKARADGAYWNPFYYGPDQKLPHCNFCGEMLLAPAEWKRDWFTTPSKCVHPDTGEVLAPLLHACVGTARSGKPKLIALAKDDGDREQAVIVFRTQIGFRGGNAHTGDRLPDHVDSYGCTYPEFAPFPGQTLVEGRIAQGDAGRAGSGRQLVAVMPRGIVFRTGYSGRLYGGPAAHYYAFDGERVHALTWEERLAAEAVDASPLPLVAS